MISFKNWFEQQSFSTPQTVKPWTATKREIIAMWQALPPGMPIPEVKSIPKGHKGSTYSYDGIRLTGSSQFINSILSRIKDMVNFEDKSKRLVVTYKQQVDKKTNFPTPNSFAFYMQIREKAALT